MQYQYTLNGCRVQRASWGSKKLFCCSPSRLFQCSFVVCSGNFFPLLMFVVFLQSRRARRIFVFFYFFCVISFSRRRIIRPMMTRIASESVDDNEKFARKMMKFGRLRGMRSGGDLYVGTSSSSAFSKEKEKCVGLESYLSEFRRVWIVSERIATWYQNQIIELGIELDSESEFESRNSSRNRNRLENRLIGGIGIDPTRSMS